MRKFLLLLSTLYSLLSTSLFVFAEKPGIEKTLDLEECIRLALLNNENLLLLKKEYEIAQQRLQETNALLYPLIDFDFNYFRYAAREEISGLPYGYTFLPYTGAKPQDYFVTRFSLNQSLYSGGRSVNARKLAKMNLKRTEIESERRKNEVIFQTKREFYDFLFAEKKTRLYESNLAYLERVYPPTVKQRLPIEEERKLSLHQTQLKSTLDNFEYEIKQAKLALLDIIGLELNTEVALKDELKALPQDLNLEKCLAWANRYRPELRQIQVEEEISLLSVNLALAERYPTLKLGADYFFAGKIFPYPEQNWLATVGISLPLFDGWAGWSRIRQSQIRLEQNKLKKVEWTDRIDLEIREAYNEILFWQKEVERWASEEKEEEKFFETLKTKLQTGEIKLEQFLSVQRDLLLVKEKSLNALRGHLVAQGKLEKAMGKSLLEK